MRYTILRTKYNRQGPMDIPKDKDERKQAIYEWAEGSRYLKSLLTKLISKGITTLVSCKGHAHRKVNSYIGFKLDKKSKNIFKYLFNLSQNKKFEFLIDNNMIRDSKKIFRFFIYLRHKNKNKIFKNIQNYEKNYNRIKIEENFQKNAKILENLIFSFNKIAEFTSIRTIRISNPNGIEEELRKGEEQSIIILYDTQSKELEEILRNFKVQKEVDPITFNDCYCIYLKFKELDNFVNTLKG